MPHLILVSLLWAFSFGLIKHHLAGVDPAFVAAVRVSLSLLVFLPFLRPAAVAPRTRLLLVGIGAVQFGLMYLAYLAAFHELQAHQIALFTIVTPVLVCVCDDLLERRFRWTPYLAAALAVIGTGVIVARRPPGDAGWTGIVLVQASNLCFALGQVWYRRWHRRHPAVNDLAVFGWLYLGAVLVTVPATWLGGVRTWPALTGGQLAVLAYLGLIASGVGFFVWNRGATRVATGVLAVMNNLKTPLGVVVALVVFGEQAELLPLLVGGGLIGGAAWWAQRADG